MHSVVFLNKVLPLSSDGAVLQGLRLQVGRTRRPGGGDLCAVPAMITRDWHAEARALLDSILPLWPGSTKDRDLLVDAIASHVNNLAKPEPEGTPMAGSCKTCEGSGFPPGWFRDANDGRWERCQSCTGLEVDALRAHICGLRAERDALKAELAAAREWQEGRERMQALEAVDLPRAVRLINEARAERDALKARLRGFANALNVGTVQAATAIAEEVLAERDALKARLRDTAQVLIEAVGAEGPCNAEEVAQRAVARIAEMEAWQEGRERAHALETAALPKALAIIDETTALRARVVLADRLAEWAQADLFGGGATNRWHADPACECLDCRHWDTLHAYLASATPVAKGTP
jgi:hypothetical protein